MRKKIYLLFVVIILCICMEGGYCLCQPAGQNEEAAGTEQEIDKFGDEPDNLYARSAVLMDGESGRVLYGKAEEEVRPMASTTKIMTCILALEFLKEHPEQIVTVSDLASAQPKVHLGMQKDEKYYLKDLLYSLMLESHNDSAVAVAEGVAGSVENFAVLMNRKAEMIGCRNTYFITPNGLDAEDEKGMHATTAKDLAAIMRYCLMQSEEKETFLEITGTRTYEFQDVEQGRTFSCRNHNVFLDMMDGAISGKTGFTGNAGYCYVGAVKKEDRVFVVALLACGWPNNKNYKWKDTMQLMRYGIEHYQYQKIELGKISSVTIMNGFDMRTPYRMDIKSPVHVITGKQPERILMREGEELKKEVNVPEAKEAPVKKGETVGNVSYSLNGKMICKYTVVSQQTVEKRSFVQMFRIVLKEVCL